MANLIRYDIKSSRSKPISVPFIVLHVLERVRMRSRTESVQFLQILEMNNLISEHKYLCKQK